MKNQKIELKEIQREHWKYILYESHDEDLYLDVVYSPVSFVDACILIKFTEEEKQFYRNNNNYIPELTEKISYNFRDYFHRSLQNDNFIFIHQKNPES